MKSPTSRVTALIAPLLFTACATVGPPRPPSLELPKPPADLRAVRKGDRITLTWTVPTKTTDRQTAHSFGATRICRLNQAELTQCGAGVGDAPPVKINGDAAAKKISASYVDTLPRTLETDAPSAFASYAVEVKNANGRSAGLSNQVRVPLMRTLPPPQDFRAKVTSRGVVLNWAGASAPARESVRYVYRVYRRLQDGKDWTLAGELPVTGEGDVSLTDSGLEWEKAYEYRVEIDSLIARTGGDEQIAGDDSNEIEVFAEDIFPPAVPSGLQAVFSGPGQKAFVDLIWAPVADVDLAGYNVYRREEGGPATKLNAELIKTLAYRDAAVLSGKHYFYSVSAVDARGNESARSEEAEESVP
ncbi:MAG TPA: hypothetical protein VMH04_14790 [Candidatus Solibacter sp.]|nr:hypothetical protein [Candidatus Solibacter sp.]